MEMFFKVQKYFYFFQESCNIIILRESVDIKKKLGTSWKNIHHDLIEACKEGERKAQLKLYKLYYRAMYNTSLRIVNDTAEAEDIMQESFLNAFQQIHTYLGNVSFGSWLKRIVVNKSLDALRKNKPEISIEEDNLDFPEIIEECLDEEIRMQAAVIRDAIFELPEEYRIVISLFLLEGYDHEEISEILKISNNLSRTRYVRAKQKILQILKEKKFKVIYNN
jgi:RNA polymerase sigma factor (sigma-70 family)